MRSILPEYLMSFLQTPQSPSKPAYQHEKSPSRSSISQHFCVRVTGLMQQIDLVIFEKSS